MSRPVVRIGARRSPLAVAQATWVAARLADAGWQSEFVGITSQGDVDPRALTQIGGTGVFAAAVRAQLLSGAVDVAVHSMKDLPTADIDGLVVAAVPEREDVREVLAGLPLDGWAALGRPVVVGTGSPRRAAQVTAWASRHGVEVTVMPVRGNVETRLALVRDSVVDATLLAAAGLHRLGLLPAGDDGGTWQGVPLTVLPVDVVRPAAAQGALALETRRDLAPEVMAAISAIDHRATRLAVTAERSFLATLEAGCTAPIAALATFVEPHLTLVGLAAHDDPERAVERSLSTNVTGGGTLLAAITLGAATAREVVGATESPPRV